MNAILKKKSSNAEEIIKTELTYYRNTHRAEGIGPPSLFKINKITHKERLTNLCILLGGMNDKLVRLPGNLCSEVIMLNLIVRRNLF